MTLERFGPSSPCPVCDGHPKLPHGQGIRCTGFTTADGYIHCTREERAGAIQPTDANPPTFAHVDRDDCRCGLTHARTAPPQEAPTPRPPPRRKVAERYWDVRDRESRVVLRHWRHDFDNNAKEYPWQRPDGAWGKGDVDIAGLIYGAELLSEPGAVIITEGEKAADALRSLGVRGAVVLGTVQGAPRAPGAAALELLSGRKVYLWPDADEVGAEQMRRVAAGLHGVAEVVKVITWGQEEKDDAADFVERGGTSADLRGLVASALVADGPSDTSWASVTVEPVRWLWHPYIPRGKVTLLEGQPGIGKSFISLAITTGVTRGHGLPGVGINSPGRVLFMSAEDDVADTLKPRIEPMDPDMHRIFTPAERFTFDADGWVRFDDALARYEPDLVVLDPLFAFFGGKVDLHRANETREVMTGLYRRAMDHRCAILGVRHLTKSGGTDAITRGIGSIDIAGAVRSILLAGVNPNDELERAIVHIKHNLSPAGMTLGYRLDADGFAWAGRSWMTQEDILRRTVPVDAEDGRLCAEWLQNELAQGARLQTEMLTAATQAGYDKPSFRAALRVLHVHQIAGGLIGLPARHEVAP